jgi:peroxiredoxin family protein
VSKNPYKICITCKKIHPPEYFITKIGNNSNNCEDCRAEGRIKDALRDRTGRDYKISDMKLKRKEKRKQWRLNNPEKSSLYSHNYREKKKRVMGIDGYRAHKAEEVKLWRKNNPDKMKIRYHKDKINIDRKIYTCSYSADLRGYKFLLTDIEATGFFQDKCYYCGEKPIEGVNLNGIDRKDSKLDYTFDNCVSACQMCNYMKNDTWDENEFIMVVEHILTIHNFTNGILYPNLFYDSKSSNYNKTKWSAINEREIEFKLSENTFNQIKQKPCYICNKSNTLTHSNGIDRVQNDICYVDYNCQSCCKNCNILKKDYSMELLFKKLVQIYQYNNDEFDITETDFNTIYNCMWNKYKPLYTSSQYMLDKTIRNKQQTGLGSKNCVKN